MRRFFCGSVYILKNTQLRSFTSVIKTNNETEILQFLWYYKEQIRICFLTKNEFCPLIYGTWLLIWYPQTFLKAISECWMTIFNETAVTSWLTGENDRLIGVSLLMRYNVAKIKPSTFLVLKKKEESKICLTKNYLFTWNYDTIQFTVFHISTITNSIC